MIILRCRIYNNRACISCHESRCVPITHVNLIDQVDQGGGAVAIANRNEASQARILVFIKSTVQLGLLWVSRTKGNANLLCILSDKTFVQNMVRILTLWLTKVGIFRNGTVC